MRTCNALGYLLLACGLQVAAGFWCTDFFQPFLKVLNRGPEQCGLGEQELGVYDRTFTLVMDGIFRGYEQNIDRFLKHHQCAGRADNQSIILEGRRAIQFLETEFGLDLSSVTDADILDGKVPLEGGKMLFHPFTFDPAGKYRVISETKREGARLFKNAPISHSGWVVEVFEPVTLNGPRFSGTLQPYAAMSAGEYVIQTAFPDHNDGKIVISYEAQVPVTVAGGRYVVFGLDVNSEQFGDGQSYGIFETNMATGEVNGREVITFPKKV
ncbi:uncharacterized protein LOC106166272 [Lingula anatina]|uniref:Uncharacterized protein LOC106166272 n=1 Tax=Lingula anatina TaxID=7574 RepID=A0A1S3IPS3_LINAN|nr:uncharacterized protein LOC106166272 [Lingula anatina]|eukprot:XP_013400220.1 uncharacterized protein LOC106166272 [Lingula anatina]